MKKSLAVTVIVTVLNEAQTINKLLSALAAQTFVPSEVIITDGGSRDNTVALINAFATEHQNVAIRVIVKKGNRSVGRNAAISASRTELTAITDAGCEPQKTWLAELMAKIDEKKVQEKHRTHDFVVAGYYEADAHTPFEVAQVPYVLVMPDQVDPDCFLPATRSMLLSKSIWVKYGGFDEKLSDNEDYAFSRKLLDNSVVILFAEKAIVKWSPRATLPQFWWMIFRFARGDISAGILRRRVIALFGRYVVGAVCVVMLCSLNQYFLAAAFAVLSFLIYLLWAIWKNIRYAAHAWYWLPALQLSADLAVMSGSLSGWYNSLSRKYAKRQPAHSAHPTST